jgi:hypothetical protein
MQNDGDVPPVFIFSSICVLAATKKPEKRFAATGSCSEKIFCEPVSMGYPRSVDKKNYNATEPCDPSKAAGFQFRPLRRLHAALREKIVAPPVSCAATPRFRRFSKHRQRLGTFAASHSSAGIAGEACRATISAANLVAPP